MPEASASRPPRRTQEERRTSTRTALLDATIDCLIDFGYNGVTTTRVVERAGLSRGAQVHHFPTKALLVAEAVTHLTQKRAGEMLSELQSGLPKDPAKRLQAVLDLLWASHTGPLFQAALEVWVAARTDPELREQTGRVEQEVTKSVWEGAAALFPEYSGRPGFNASLETALATMRGLALLSFITGDDDATNRRRWREARKRLLQMFDSDDPAPARKAA